MNTTQPAPGTIWQTPRGNRFIIRDDGRALHYPSMNLALLWPDLTNATQLHVESEDTK